MERMKEGGESYRMSADRLLSEPSRLKLRDWMLLFGVEKVDHLASLKRDICTTSTGAFPSKLPLHYKSETDYSFSENSHRFGERRGQGEEKKRERS